MNTPATPSFPNRHYTRMLLGAMLHRAFTPRLAEGHWQILLNSARYATSRQAMDVAAGVLGERITLTLHQANDWSRLIGLDYTRLGSDDEEDVALSVHLKLSEFPEENCVAIAELRVNDWQVGRGGQLQYKTQGFEGPAELQFRDGQLIHQVREPMMGFLLALMQEDSPVRVHPQSVNGMKTIGFMLENLCTTPASD